MFSKFWIWYGRNYQLNLVIAVILFSLQIVHLFWLLLSVSLPKLGYPNVFGYFSFINFVLILVDYTEIPALISTSLVYVNELRSKHTFKPVLYLIFLNVQWLHIFWITDEFIVETFYFSGALWWFAILIDYLELPVIIDTVNKLAKTFKRGNSKLALEFLREK